MGRQQGQARRGAPKGETRPVAGMGSGAADSGRIQGLDGLRALAVGLVVLFHLWPGTVRGGFLGVDVFFVISGFLITTLLLREVRRNGYMNMPTFWMRRIRRLVPALVLLLLVCTALVLVVDLTRGGDLRVGLGRQVLGGLTFSTNWVEISHGTSYFDQNQPVLYKPLWSLSVEEQFYLFWPPALALLIALTGRWRERMAVVSVVGVLSAVWMAVLYVTAPDVTRPYYGTDSHLFGLMAGVMVSFLWMSRRSVLRGAAWRRWRGPAGVGSLAGVLLLALAMPEDRAVTYTGGLFLVSLLTAVVIAALLPGRTALHRVLELRPMEWVGERSYGLYLWHWPVLLLLEAALPAQTPGSLGSFLTRLLALALAVAATEASYRWVETPVRRMGFRAWALQAVEAVRGPAERGRPVPRGARPARRGAVPGVRARGALRPPVPARVTAGAAVVALLMGGVAVATAPEKTETQLAIEAGEKELAEMPGAQVGPDGEVVVPGDPTGPDTSPAPGASPSPTGEPDASPSPDASSSPAASPSSTPSPEPGESTAPTGKGSDWYVPKGNQVSVFGDSLVVTSLHGFKEEFPGLAVDAKSNRQWPEGQSVIRAHLRAGDVRDSVVIAFGTNAGVRDQKVVRDTLDDLGPERQVVLVNLFGKSTWIDESNDNLRQIAEDYPNVAVADWHALVSQHPEWLQSDGVHPGIEGGFAYGAMVRDTFAAQAGEKDSGD
ncbi:hypothetical protein CYJ76_06565 [Kytococcus schroeteri]|uniref:Acyltransferase 3 domain-containing protein n=1 Tax=Kytococcus schroeteri TaxID=138300 RepID=A0A2I1PAR8_9MICO|nr:acyltransferase family protein [Kytococcus schroeteri]PKZ41717.1 hypothetical protein CYJ76_06565 [Kytococcus schroeteri]